MFDQFPKTRPPLPEAIQAIYAAHYKVNREGETAATSVAQRMERWLHRKVAADVVGQTSQNVDQEIATLEVGAGTLNQFAYEPELGPYDIIEPFTELIEGSALLPRVRNTFADISEIPSDTRYDRITAIAVFEHICNLPEVVAKAGLLLKPGGTLRVAIPSEGTILWTLGWKLTTGIEFRLKHGQDYGKLMRHEHVNTAQEIETVLRHFFENVKCQTFGPCRALSFYQYFECSNPILDRCCER
ncbi:MAG: methyltransferase type 12 [Blastopirellula sp.]|nr:MAG: methyltransferase type 12 [Blastopirellula sp.]